MHNYIYLSNDQGQLLFPLQLLCPVTLGQPQVDTGGCVQQQGLLAATDVSVVGLLIFHLLKGFRGVVVTDEDAVTDLEAEVVGDSHVMALEVCGTLEAQHLVELIGLISIEL